MLCFMDSRRFSTLYGGGTVVQLAQVRLVDYIIISSMPDNDSGMAEYTSEINGHLVGHHA